MLPIPIHPTMRRSVMGARADDPVVAERRTAARRPARQRLAPRRARVARKPATAPQS